MSSAKLTFLSLSSIAFALNEKPILQNYLKQGNVFSAVLGGHHISMDILLKKDEDIKAHFRRGFKEQGPMK